MLRLLPLLSIALLLAACASAGGVESEDTPARSNEIITQQELATIDVATAYEVVQRLRPGWLRGRGPVSITGAGGAGERPVVYVDGVRSGEIPVLETVPAGVLTEIRFLSGRDASVAFGLNHGAGAIMVETGG